jgi:hypothetical protein
MVSQQGLNVVVVMGNVLVAPTPHAAGLAIKIGCVERFKNGDTWEEREVPIPVLVHGKRGVSLQGVLKIGDRILVEGSLDVHGESRWVRASNVVLCGGRKPQAQSVFGATGTGDDLPF